MTTKDDVEKALALYASKKSKKSEDRRELIASYQAELREVHDILARWVSGVERLKIEKVAAETQLCVEGECVAWHALVLKFSDTSIEFQPKLQEGRLYLSVKDFKLKGQESLLRRKHEYFEAFDDEAYVPWGTFAEPELYQWIIGAANKQPII